MLFVGRYKIPQVKAGAIFASKARASSGPNSAAVTGAYATGHSHISQRLHPFTKAIIAGYLDVVGSKLPTDFLQSDLGFFFPYPSLCPASQIV